MALKWLCSDLTYHNEERKERGVIISADNQGSKGNKNDYKEAVESRTGVI